MAHLYPRWWAVWWRGCRGPAASRSGYHRLASWTPSHSSPIGTWHTIHYTRTSQNPNPTSTALPSILPVNILSRRFSLTRAPARLQPRTLWRKVCRFGLAVLWPGEHDLKNLQVWIRWEMLDASPGRGARPWAAASSCAAGFGLENRGMLGEWKLGSFSKIKTGKCQQWKNWKMSVVVRMYRVVTVAWDSD